MKTTMIMFQIFSREKESNPAWIKEAAK